MPLILGAGAADPGLRGEPPRPRGRRTRPSSTSPSPTTTPRPSWPASRRTSRSSSASCARRSCPSSTTTSSGRSATSPTSPRCGRTSRARLERNALDRARHGFADRIIDYAVANATVELPDILVEQEVEVMHDEFRGTLARQGITEEAYLKAVDKTERTSTRSSGRAPRSGSGRCSCSRRSPTRRASTVADAEVEAEVAARSRALRGRPEAARLLRLGARPVLHPQHAAAQPGGREASSTSGWPPTPTTPPLPHLEDAPGVGRRRASQAAANVARRRDRSRRRSSTTSPAAAG